MAVELLPIRGGDRCDAGGAGRITIPEIAARLSIGRLAVYDMLEKGIMRRNPPGALLDYHSDTQLRHFGA